MTRRFVILHHRLADSEHWDMMIEDGDRLATWQLLADPRLAESWPIPARRIADHRPAYLEYEGPISGERGQVTRIDEGVCDAPAPGGGVRSWRFSGRVLAGRYEIQPDPAGELRRLMRRDQGSP